METLILKSLHIIFVITWFAGLFYLPRLFIYHTEANTLETTAKKILQDQFKIMERRLLFGIMWPSAIMVAIFGFATAMSFWPWSNHLWLLIKLVFVFFLYLYHFSLHYIYKRLAHDEFPYSPMKLRVWNEVSSLFVVAIVFLVVLKSVLHLGYALLGLIFFVFALLIAIKIYKNIRAK